jgi:hypothetical protein
MRLGVRSPARDICFTQNGLHASHWGSAIPAFARVFPSIRNAIPALRIAFLEIAPAIHESQKGCRAFPLRSLRHVRRALRWRERSMHTRERPSRLGVLSVSWGSSSSCLSRSSQQEIRCVMQCNRIAAIPMMGRRQRGRSSSVHSRRAKVLTREERLFMSTTSRRQEIINHAKETLYEDKSERN